MNHVMIDLETWGTAPGSALRSIGACVFDPNTGAIGGTFYTNITRASCEALHLTVDRKTEEWWSQQSAEARAALEPDQQPLFKALVDFEKWFGDVGGEFVWGHGASFDPVLLEAAYAAVSMDAPWKFWNIRCCRTVLTLGNRRVVFARGVAHNALDDAIAQAEAVSAALEGKLPVGRV